MTTEIVNVRDAEDWDVYIGREGQGETGYFGNPFKVGAKYTRSESLAYFEDYLYQRVISDEEFKMRLEELRGKRLACFCKPLPCHGDILKEYLDNEN